MTVRNLPVCLDGDITCKCATAFTWYQTLAWVDCCLCVWYVFGVCPTWPQALVWPPGWQGPVLPSPTLVSTGPRARRSRLGRAGPSPAASWLWWSRYEIPAQRARRGERKVWVNVKNSEEIRREKNCVFRRWDWGQKFSYATAWSMYKCVVFRTLLKNVFLCFLKMIKIATNAQPTCSQM